MQVGNVLLETIGKLNKVSKFISVFSDSLVVMINPSSLVPFDNCSQFGVQEPQFLFHLSFGALLLISFDLNTANVVDFKVFMTLSLGRSYIIILPLSLKSSPTI